MNIFSVAMKDRSRGFSLIEVIVVVALLSIIALTGTNTIVEFQRNAVLTAATQELASTIRTAQTNSIAGQIGSGETYGSFDPDGLPFFGVAFSGNSYQLVRIYKPYGAGTYNSPETVEPHTVDADITLTTSPVLSPAVVSFARVTGLPNTGVTITLTRPNGTAKTITVGSNGLISL